MQATRMNTNRVIRQCTRKNVHRDHAPVDGTYNDLPQPHGHWKTHNDAQQRKYNMHLALGVATFVGTILFGKVAGLWEFHNEIPEHIAKIDSYK